MVYKTHKFKKELNVLMMPDYRDINPYQYLLANALEAEHINVFFSKDYRRILPIFRTATQGNVPYQIFHLHWIAPYIKGNNIFIKLIYAFKFLFDIFLVRWAGIQIIWTVHNLVSHDTQFAKLELWIRQCLSQLVHRVIVHNHSMVKSISQTYKFPESKVTVIPIGHYRNVYSPSICEQEARRQLGLSSQGLIYLNQGVIRPYKGIERLLKVWISSFSILPHNNLKHSLIIAGCPLDERYGNLLKKQIENIDNVYLKLEFIEDVQITTLYSAANVAILPFERILTSSSILVAMSFGKPIIAPRLGGIPETLAGADDLLYDPDDDQGLVKALDKSTKIDLDELSHRTVEACDRLNWQTIAQQTKAVYS